MNLHVVSVHLKVICVYIRFIYVRWYAYVTSTYISVYFRESSNLGRRKEIHGKQKKTFLLGR